jgi:hypothetical protein
MANPLRRTKAPGETEFSALIQLFPQPALVVDSTRDLIVNANSAFLQLTAFALTEITGRAPREFIPDLPSSPQATEEPFFVSLERRGRSPLLITVQIKLLDAGGQWRLLVCQPQEDQHLRLMQQLEKSARAVIAVNRLRQKRMAKGQPNMPPISSARRWIITRWPFTSWKSQGCSRRAVHWSVVKGICCRIVFRGAIGCACRRPSIWKPGRRVQTELHRLGRMNNLSYIASALCGKNSLLVIAEKDHEANDEIGIILEVMAGGFGQCTGISAG